MTTLGQYSLAPFLGIEDDALADSAFHDGIGAPAVVEDSDTVAQLAQHQVHLDLKLVGLHHKAVTDAGIWAAGGATGIGPLFHHFGVGAAGQIVGRAPDGPRDFGQAGEPLLLDAPDIGFCVEGKAGDQKDVTRRSRHRRSIHSVPSG